MAVKRPGRRVVVCALMLGAVCLDIGRAELHGASPSPSQLVLNLRFTSTQPLPAATFDAMVAETEAIWRPAHLQVRWADAEAQDAALLRVIVMARLVPPEGQGVPWAVGELVTHDDAPPLAIASVTGARRILDLTSRFRLLDSPAAQDRGLGVVLGRAIAHEIGHFLLRTTTHASTGLMRSFIDAREFANPATNGFKLDKAAVAYMAALAAAGTLSPEHPSLTGFSY